jgi:predicted nucleotidyltransferase component of viral defense system
LNPWLGDPKRKITERSVKLIYQYQAVNGLPAKLKIEINTTEHFQVLPLKYKPFSVDSEWFSGSCEIITYELAELIATKLRALYQRRKGRDLFDLWHVFKDNLVDRTLVIDIFEQYCANSDIKISRELFQKNMALKKLHKDFQIDMNILLPHTTKWDFEEAYNFVQNYIIDALKD